MNKADIIVKIRKNATGEIREYKSEVTVDAGERPSSFVWRDGNYACDCNRQLFWNWAENEQDEDIDCSHGVYSVRVSLADSGDVYYDEF